MKKPNYKKIQQDLLRKALNGSLATLRVTKVGKLWYVTDCMTTQYAVSGYVISVLAPSFATRELARWFVRQAKQHYHDRRHSSKTYRKRA